MDKEKIFNLLKLGLQNKTLNKGKSIAIKRIYLLNHITLTIEFIPKSTFGSDIKVETFYIMKFIALFGIDNPYFPSQINHIGVRALNKNNEETMYAITPLDLLQKQGPIEIEWFKSTVFQENTFDHRLTQAKRIIATLENALRDLIINRLFADYGSDWWKLKIHQKIRLKAEGYFEDQNGYKSSSPAELIKYTFLLDLKKIICTDWVSFRTVLSNKIRFENSMDTLNSIRKDEGHNRDVSHSNIAKLQKIYDSLMGDISEFFPDLVESFLVDNWRQRLSEIIWTTNLPFKEADVLSEQNQQMKLAKSGLNIQALRKHCTEIESELSTVVIPPNKQTIHNKLTMMFEDLGNAYDGMLEASKMPDIKNLKNAQNRVEHFSTKTNEFILKYLLSES